ncbi:hypothetical protein [Actinoplanes solisilvae]|uniref:hypothetical protein n=1 Tax=Actinoplanes solisilvae TaxID=2486853 RepID=UPI00196AA87D|nr:hypothetical protein [Actinoplanes solisilvae]
MEFVADNTATDWLLRSRTPDMRLITFGPAGFEAYARLRFIRDPLRPGEQEADVHLPEDHPSEIDQSRRALHLLAAFTSTPLDCYFCLWEGYSDTPLPAEARDGPLVELPHRRFALFRGPLRDIDTWEADFGGGHPVAPPAFVWPADRSWCFTADVDPHWAGIGAGRDAVDALVAAPGLDVVPADPSEPQPAYR